MSDLYDRAMTFISQHKRTHDGVAPSKADVIAGIGARPGPFHMMLKHLRVRAPTAWELFYQHIGETPPPVDPSEPQPVLDVDPHGLNERERAAWDGVREMRTENPLMTIADACMRLDCSIATYQKARDKVHGSATVTKASCDACHCVVCVCQQAEEIPQPVEPGSFHDENGQPIEVETDDRPELPTAAEVRRRAKTRKLVREFSAETEVTDVALKPRTAGEVLGTVLKVLDDVPSRRDLTRILKAVATFYEIPGAALLAYKPEDE